MQVGAFLAVVFSGVILWLRPDAPEAAAAAAGITTAAARSSYVRYRHIRLA
ncbi:hypothetical protein ACWF94_04175 [Streptomyces sp. NPDC055078]